MKRCLKIFVAVLGVALLGSCQLDRAVDVGNEPAREGYLRINFETRCPDMTEVSTRAVDPDGVGVQDLTLFCFDAYGVFITTVTATVTQNIPQPSVSGSFTAEVPDLTRRIHFLANQNMSYVDESDFRNLTEAAVMAAMEGSSGKIIYWGRFACDASDERPVNEQMRDYAVNNEIILYRNHARISIADWNTEWLEVTGFVTYNAPAFGTVAPYHSTEGFVWPGSEPFVTLPQNSAVMSEILDVDTDVRDYVFESENSIDNPVSVIIRGRVPGSSEELYYRVLLLDENGEQLLIRRNHHYRINIAGKLSFGKKTFAEAVNAAATNNIWLSISDEIQEVADNNYSLAVDQTSVVLDESYAGSGYVLGYTVTPRAAGVTLTEADKPEISWVSGNNVATNHIAHSFNPTTGRGELTVQLLPMSAEDMQQGSIIVKKGRLQRKIKLMVIKEQKFTPSWIGTQIYGEATGQKVTLKFTIPETCPKELFPFNVYISAQSLDIRASSGMQLSIIDSNSPEFGENRGSHYKYVYPVTHAGAHRLYFENVQTAADGDKHNLVLEAEFFESITKYYNFMASQNAITMTNMRSHTEGANDEPVFYRVVPPKQGAPLPIDMIIMNKETEEPLNVDPKDEFLFFSKSVTFYPDDQVSEFDIPEFDCAFWFIPENIWSASTDGRALLFKPNRPTAPLKGTGKYSIYMRTLYAKSDDIVRISSNGQPNPSFHPDNNGAAYDGNRYRSTIFDLFTFPPFRFAAQVNNEGEYVSSGEDEESVDAIQWEYGKGKPVTVSFDVTSYRNTKRYYGDEPQGTSVDPFGQAFDIYIDAPMLEIDQAAAAAMGLTEAKFRPHPTVAGRFIYTVEATRDAERALWREDAFIDDTSVANPSQAGERKNLPFRTKRVVSLGEIKISTDEEQILYYDKTFSVTNKSIEGVITFGTVDVQELMPKDAFVVLQRVSDGARVGSFTIDRDGHFLLRLRNEYTINWDLDEYKVDYTDYTDTAGGGRVYVSNIIKLQSLMTATPTIELILSE